jgi:hypothetical protein
MSDDETIDQQIKQLKATWSTDISTCSTDSNSSFDKYCEWFLGDPFEVMYHKVIIAKRRKLNDTEDKYYLQPLFTTGKEGFTVLEDKEQVDSFVFHEPKEQEYFSPFLPIEDPVEQYKSGLKVDKLSGVKRLKDPKRWCVLPLSETKLFEVPLTPKEQVIRYKVTQEIGHVAWYKAVFYVDKNTYEENTVEVEVEQVLKKVDLCRVPRWRQRNTSWSIKEFGVVEVPRTVFCTETETIKKLKFFNGTRPDIVHHNTVAKTTGDNRGCSIFRKHIPPCGINPWGQSPPGVVARDKAILAGFENRTQWIHNSLYKIWAGEEEEGSWDRPLWTGPARHFDPVNFFQCHYSPYCDRVDEVEESDAPTSTDQQKEFDEFYAV